MVGAKEMRSIKGFPKHFCSKELLTVAGSKNERIMTELLLETTRRFLPYSKVKNASMSMWSALKSETQCGSGVETAPNAVRFDQPAGRKTTSRGAVAGHSRSDNIATGRSHIVEVKNDACRPRGWSGKFPNADERKYTYLFLIPHKMQNRIALEFDFGAGLRDSSDGVRMEYLVAIFYLAGLHFYDVIDHRTAEEWMVLIEGLSPIQLMILREAVCAPRYNLTVMSERLGIAKRGISGQLYRIHKAVEPKLPEATCDEGNGSPLVDLVRAYGFLQFAGVICDGACARLVQAQQAQR